MRLRANKRLLTINALESDTKYDDIKEKVNQMVMTSQATVWDLKQYQAFMKMIYFFVFVCRICGIQSINLSFF